MASPPGSGDFALDLGLGEGNVRADESVAPVDDNGRIRPRPVPKRLPEPLDRCGVDNADVDPRAVPVEQGVDPVRKRGEVGAQVVGERFAGLLPVYPLPDARPPEHDLAVLAVSEDRRGVRDDVDAYAPVWAGASS
jgi:hypothetical protein